MADIQNDSGFQRTLADLANRCEENGYAPTPLTRADLDQLLTDNGLVTAPPGTPEIVRERNRIIGAMTRASMREGMEGRLPFRLVVVDRKMGQYRLMPKADFVRERPSQHFVEITRHHARHIKELARELDSKIIADEQKLMLVVYIAGCENAIEQVKETATKLLMAIHQGPEALEALGRQIAAEAAQRRISNQFAPLRGLAGIAIAAE